MEIFKKSLLTLVFIFLFCTHFVFAEEYHRKGYSDDLYRVTNDVPQEQHFKNFMLDLLIPEILNAARKKYNDESISGMSLDKESPLVTTNTGKSYSPSYLSQYLTKTITETKLPFLMNRSSAVGPHTFRHAFAIISHLSKVDIYQIMRSLGHEKIETTMIYLEKVFEKERHAIHAWKPEVFGEYI